MLSSEESHISIDIVVFIYANMRTAACKSLRSDEANKVGEYTIVQRQELRWQAAPQLTWQRQERSDPDKTDSCSHPNSIVSRLR